MSTKEAEKPKSVSEEPTKEDKQKTSSETEKTDSKDNGASDGEPKIVDPEELIDMNTFDQLLDMDDEEDHEFSYSIVLNYFEQAEQTFTDMDSALEKKDLSELSRLGHFLKGSSAAIGLKKVKATCEKIQNIGNKQDEVGSASIEEGEALEKITKLLPQVKAEYKEAEEYLKSFYDQDAR